MDEEDASEGADDRWAAPLGERAGDAGGQGSGEEGEEEEEATGGGGGGGPEERRREPLGASRSRLESGASGGEDARDEDEADEDDEERGGRESGEEGEGPSSSSRRSRRKATESRDEGGPRRRQATEGAVGEGAEQDQAVGAPCVTVHLRMVEELAARWRRSGAGAC